jgi:hypothetical protein
MTYSKIAGMKISAAQFACRLFELGISYHVTVTLSRRFEFDEGARRLAGSLESNIGSPDARRGEFCDYGQFEITNKWQQGFEQPLKRGRESLLKIGWPRAPQFANPGCV